MIMYLSLSKFRGYLNPGGNSGFSSGLGGSVVLALAFAFDGLDELPAFPDLTIPLLGGIRL